MKLNRIFIWGMILGIVLLYLDDLLHIDTYWALYEFLGGVLVLLTMLGIVINTCAYLSSFKDSVIDYQQLVQERVSIIEMLNTDKDVDRFKLNAAVINYNNRVIEAKVNSKRPILGEYYSTEVDWDALECISWK